MFKLDNINSRKTCQTCSKVTIEAPKNVNNVNADMYLFKINNRNARKCVKHVQS